MKRRMKRRKRKRKRKGRYVGLLGENSLEQIPL
jgi:hypothetical protein